MSQEQTSVRHTKHLCSRLFISILETGRSGYDCSRVFLDNVTPSSKGIHNGVRHGSIMGVIAANRRILRNFLYAKANILGETIPELLTHPIRRGSV